jgi:hypothetical protein
MEQADGFEPSIKPSEGFVISVSPRLQNPVPILRPEGSRTLHPHPDSPRRRYPLWTRTIDEHESANWSRWPDSNRHHPLTLTCLGGRGDTAANWCSRQESNLRHPSTASCLEDSADTGATWWVRSDLNRHFAA